MPVFHWSGYLCGRNEAPFTSFWLFGEEFGLALRNWDMTGVDRLIGFKEQVSAHFFVILLGERVMVFIWSEISDQLVHQLKLIVC